MGASCEPPSGEPAVEEVATRAGQVAASLPGAVVHETRRISSRTTTSTRCYRLDPYMFRRVPLTDLPGLVADLGYSYIELSPRTDFLPFFLHPRADKGQIAAFSKALAAAGVQISSVLHLAKHGAA